MCCNTMHVTTSLLVHSCQVCTRLVASPYAVKQSLTQVAADSQDSLPIVLIKHSGPRQALQCNALLQQCTCLGDDQ